MLNENNRKQLLALDLQQTPNELLAQAANYKAKIFNGRLVVAPKDVPLETLQGKTYKLGEPVYNLFTGLIKEGTANWNPAWSGICAGQVMVISTWPWAVNFRALPAKLLSTCRMRPGSPTT